MEGGDGFDDEVRGVKASVRRAANFRSIKTTYKESATSWKANGTWRPDIFPKVQRDGRLTTLGKQFDLSWKPNQSPIIGHVYDRWVPRTPSASYRPPRSNRSDGDSQRPSAQRATYGGFFSGRRKGKAVDARAADTASYGMGERQRLQGASLLAQPVPETADETEAQLRKTRAAKAELEGAEQMQSSHASALLQELRRKEAELVRQLEQQRAYRRSIGASDSTRSLVNGTTRGCRTTAKRRSENAAADRLEGSKQMVQTVPEDEAAAGEEADTAGFGSGASAYLERKHARQRQAAAAAAGSAEAQALPTAAAVSPSSGEGVCGEFGGPNEAAADSAAIEEAKPKSAAQEKALAARQRTAELAKATESRRSQASSGLDEPRGGATGGRIRFSGAKQTATVETQTDISLAPDARWWQLCFVKCLPSVA